MEVGLTTLEERRVRGDMIQTFRILNGIDQVEPGQQDRVEKELLQPEEQFATVYKTAA